MEFIHRVGSFGSATRPARQEHEAPPKADVEHISSQPPFNHLHESPVPEANKW